MTMAGAERGGSNTGAHEHTFCSFNGKLALRVQTWQLLPMASVSCREPCGAWEMSWTPALSPYGVFERLSGDVGAEPASRAVCDSCFLVAWSAREREGPACRLRFATTDLTALDEA